jgi:drug/metabolite transporter (DMT)-like permease
MNAARRSMAWMIAFVALWALVEALASDLHRRYSPWQVVWTRYAVHLLLMLAAFGWRDPGSLWRTRRPAFQLARSLLMVAMPAAAVFGLAGGLDADTLMAGFWLAPLLILGLALSVLRERVPAMAWIACGVAFAGTLLSTVHGDVPSARQFAYPLAMALSFSVYVVMTRSLRTEATRVNLFYTALGVFVVLTPLMPREWVAPDGHDLALMGAIGAVGLGALCALDRFAHAAPVSIAAPMAYLQLPIALALALATGAGHPIIRPGALAGLLLVGAAAAAAWLRASRLVVQDPA